jgi:hypothetical protein
MLIDMASKVNLKYIMVGTEIPLKWGVCHLKIDRGILDEARMHKYTQQAFRYNKRSDCLSDYNLGS